MIKDISFKLKEIKMDNNDINISQKQLDSILQYAQKISIKDLNNYVENDLSDLKKKALKYIKTTEELAFKTRLLNNLYNKRKQIKNLVKKGQSLAYELQQNTQQIRQIVLTQGLLKSGVIQTAIFTKELQEKLGKSSQLIYIHQSKNGNEVRMYRINKIQDIIKIQKGHAGQLQARLSATLEQLKNLEKHGKGSQIKVELQEAKNLDKTYSAILQRYNTYNYKGNHHLILWQMRGSRPKWHGLWRSETGTLAQTYANVVLNRKFDNFIGNVGTTRQTDIEFFASLVEEAIGTFGGLEGDVEYLNQNSYIASAIKSGSASPQGLLETVKLAYAILNLPEDIDEVKFLQVMEKYHYRKQQKELIKKFTNKEVKELKRQLT